MKGGLKVCGAAQWAYGTERKGSESNQQKTTRPITECDAQCGSLLPGFIVHHSLRTELGQLFPTANNAGQMIWTSNNAHCCMRIRYTKKSNLSANQLLYHHGVWALSSDPRTAPIRAQNMSSLNFTSSFQVFSSHETASANDPVRPLGWEA